MKPSIPEIFYTETSDLYSQFMDISDRAGDTKEYCDQLFGLIPQGIKTTAVWKDGFRGIWRYEYGVPYKKLDNKLEQLLGTDQFPPIEVLYLVLKVAEKYLTHTQLLLYRQRLSNETKHMETLFEMRPLTNISPGYEVKFEVVGYGLGKKSIDWLVISNDYCFLFDVKHRRKSFINQIGNIDLSKSNSENIKSAMPPNPSDLFRSTVEKLKSIENNIIQGVWITTSIKENKNSLDDYFQNSLDSSKIQFAIISDWKDDGYILTRNETQRETIKKVFNISESDRFVTNYPMEYTPPNNSGN